MPGQWYCRIAGEERGPLTTAELRALAADGRLSTSDPVRQGELGIWFPAASIKGLFDTPADTHGPSGTQPVPEEPTPPRRSRPLLRAQPIDPSAEPLHAPTHLPHDAGIDLGDESVVVSTPPMAPKKAKGRWQATGLEFLAEEASAIPRPLTAAPGAKIAARSKDSVTGVRRWLLPGLLALLGILVLVLLAVSYQREYRSAETSPVPVASGKTQQPGEIGRQADKGKLVGTKRPPAAMKGPPPPPGEPSSVTWIDASRGPWKCGEVTVTVRSAVIGRAKLIDAAKRVFDTQDDYLLIAVELANQSGTRKIEYTGWGLRGGEPQLVDDLNNKYALQRAPGGGMFEGQLKAKSIYPEKSVEDLLVFERPVERAKYLRLRLPAGAFEGQGTGYLEIPMSMVKFGSAPVAAKPPATAAPAKSHGETLKPGERPQATGAKAPIRGFAGAAAASGEPPPKPTGTPESDFGIKPEDAPTEIVPLEPKAAPPPLKRGPPPPLPEIKKNSPEMTRE